MIRQYLLATVALALFAVNILAAPLSTTITQKTGIQSQISSATLMKGELAIATDTGVLFTNLSTGGNYRRVRYYPWKQSGSGVNAATFTHISSAATNALPLTGGVVSGAIVGTDANFKVGVGTATPASSLSVKGAEGTTFSIQNSATATERIKMFVGTGGSYAANESYFQLMNSKLHFKAGVGATIEAMAIDTAGNVGIGTSSPGYLFDVSGISRLQGDSYIKKIFLWTDGTGAHITNTGSGNTGIALVTKATTDPITFSYNSTELMRIQSTGNIGIGTASPISAYKLQVNVSLNQNFGIRTLNGELTLDSSNDAGSTTPPMGFRASEFHFAAGTGTGNVGIGTAAPTAKLQVSSTPNLSTGVAYGLAITPTYSQTGSAGSADLYINRVEATLGGGDQDFIEAAVGGSERFSVANSGDIFTAGNVGIGTTVFGTSATQTLALANGTAPTTSITGAQIWSTASGLNIVPSGSTAATTIGAAAATFPGTVTATQYNVPALLGTPASKTASGTLGEIRVAADGIYVATAQNVWRQAMLNYFYPGLGSVAIGTSALGGTYTGSYGTAVGNLALSGATSGGANTAVGYSALASVTTGGSNTAIGMNALLNLAGASAGNVGIGYGAGKVIADGSTALVSATNSIYIGIGARGTNSDNNSIVIGASVVGAGANTVVLGNDSITATYLKGTVSVASGGSANHTICWKADGKTLGYCSQIVDASGVCGTCN